jgi:hypothetical protein
MSATWKPFLHLALLLGISACSQGSSPITYGDALRRSESANPVGRWAVAGVRQDGDMTRVYTINTRDGRVCENEFYPGVEAGSRGRSSQCSAAGDVADHRDTTLN